MDRRYFRSSILVWSTAIIVVIGIVIAILSSTASVERYESDDWPDYDTQLVLGREVRRKGDHYFVESHYGIKEYIRCLTCQGDTYFEAFCTNTDKNSKCIPCPIGSSQPKDIRHYHLQTTCSVYNCDYNHFFNEDLKRCVNCDPCPEGTVTSKMCSSYVSELVCCDGSIKSGGNENCKFYPGGTIPSGDIHHSEDKHYSNKDLTRSVEESTIPTPLQISVQRTTSTSTKDRHEDGSHHYSSGLSPNENKTARELTKYFPLVFAVAMLVAGAIFSIGKCIAPDY